MSILYIGKMRKSSKKNILKKFKKTAKNVVPVVETGLKTIGTAAKNVSVKAKPVVEKGVSSIYGVLATGFDMGVKGVSDVASKLSNKKKTMKKRTKRTKRTKRGKKH
jgi:hypothetical protein